MQYADLTLRINRRVPPNCYQPIPMQRAQLLPMSTLPRRLPSSLGESSLYGQISGKSIYIPPPHQYMTTGIGQGRSLSIDETNAETPLIGCDGKVGMTRISAGPTPLSSSSSFCRLLISPGRRSNVADHDHYRGRQVVASGAVGEHNDNHDDVTRRRARRLHCHRNA